MIRVTTMALVLCAWQPAFAHGGGLNAEGCHTNRRTGDYHCHSGVGTGLGGGSSNPSVRLPRMRAVPPVESPAIFRPQALLNAAPVGDLVKRVQSELLRLSYASDLPDNALGAKTLFAVMKFQEAEGYEVDGIVSEQLLARLVGASPRPSSAPACPTPDSRP